MKLGKALATGVAEEHPVPVEDEIVRPEEIVDADGPAPVEVPAVR
ncbi:hypothetical protein [Streptomyces sp. enrichment culture]